ncbi:MAG: hypothetical protein ACRCVE_01390 [Plesiomonas sp.]
MEGNRLSYIQPQYTDKELKQKNNDFIFDGNISASIDTLVQQMFLLAKRMRDLLQDYNQKQQIYAWNIKILAIDKKLDSIEATKGSAILSSVGQITGGCIGVGLSFTPLGGVISSPISQVTNSIFGTASASKGAVASQKEQRANLIDTGAMSYLDSLKVVSNKFDEVMKNFFDFFHTIVNLKSRLLESVKFQS